MTPAEHEVWSRYLLGWAAADAIVDVDEFVRRSKASQWGGSGFTLNGERAVMQTTAKGVELYQGHGGWGHAVLTLRWKQLVEWSRSLPQAARDEAALIARRSVQHQVDAPRYTATAPEGLSRADSRAELDEQRRRWTIDRWDPWCAAGRELRADQEALLARWLPAPQIEQLDLFGEAVSR